MTQGFPFTFGVDKKQVTKQGNQSGASQISRKKTDKPVFGFWFICKNINIYIYIYIYIGFWFGDDSFPMSEATRSWRGRRRRQARVPRERVLVNVTQVVRLSSSKIGSKGDRILVPGGIGFPCSGVNPAKLVHPQSWLKNMKAS